MKLQTLFLCAALTSSAHAADLTLVVSGIRDDQGQILVGVFDKAESFLKKPLTGRFLPASVRDADGQLKLVIDNLPPGQYAVSVLHDRDSNGRLTTNILGLPSEPLGVSGKGGGFGPPSFADALLRVDAAGATVEIQLQ